MAKYIYFKPVQADGHYPYASEVARILYDRFGLATKNGKMATRFIGALLEDLRVSKKDPKLYYPTRNGMAQVYPSTYEVLQLVSSQYRQMQEEEDPTALISCKVGGSNYTFHFEKSEEEKA